MVVTPRAFRVDFVELGARVRIRRAMDVAPAMRIAVEMGVLVAVEDAGASPRG